MKILKSSEFWFEWIGILKVDEKHKPFITTLTKNVFCLLFVGLFGCQISSAFIFHHFDELEKSMVAVMVFLACVSTCGVYFFLRVKSEEIDKLKSGFQDLFDEGMQNIDLCNKIMLFCFKTK